MWRRSLGRPTPVLVRGPLALDPLHATALESNRPKPPHPCPCFWPPGISPQTGPVFGNTELLLHGLRFRDGKIQV